MLTKKDIANIRQVFSEEFDRKFTPAFDEAFDRKFDAKFDAAFDRKLNEVLPDILQQFRNEIAIFKDEILSVLHPLQTDHDVLAGRTGLLWDQVDEHETRIFSLEKRNRSSS